MDKRVCVVTVTYGERWSLLRRVLAAVMAQKDVVGIVVVDNGVPYDLEQRLKECDYPAITTVKMGENTGPARGYCAGMRAAQKLAECELLWLLDDDNIPDRGALEELLHQYENLTVQVPREKLALLSMRADRRQYAAVASGDEVEKWFPRINSILGFHLAQVPGKIVRRLSPVRSHASGQHRDVVKIPFGIYGGLLFHRSLLETVGFPREDLYLYGDDSDFTARITRSGGSVCLVPRSRVEDAEVSWIAAGTARNASFAKRLSNAGRLQIYYGVRNGMWFSREYYCRNPLIFGLNTWFYVGWVGFGLLFRGQIGRFCLVMRAVRDGLTGKLGKREDMALPDSSQVRTAAENDV